MECAKNVDLNVNGPLLAKSNCLQILRNSVYLVVANGVAMCPSFQTLRILCLQTLRCLQTTSPYLRTALCLHKIIANSA